MQDPQSVARELAPLIRSHRRRTEAERRLAEPIVEQLRETRLCRMALEADLGGLETPPIELLRVHEELAAAEASASWIVWNASLVCFFARFLEPSARKEVFANPRWLYAQSTRPTGRAEATGDGYRVHGRWSLLSGCELADWLMLHCALEERGEPAMDALGRPSTRFVFVPRSEVEILDTWHVGGLRGTGSHDVVVEGSVVRDAHSLSPFEPVTKGAHPMARVAIMPVLSAAFAAQTLGLARACWEHVFERAQTEEPVGPSAGLRDRPDALLELALLRSGIDAARSHLYQRIGALWEAARAGDPAPLDLRGRAFAASLNTQHLARRCVDSTYALGGTRSLYEDDPIERAHRDLHAMLRHVVAQTSWSEDASRVSLGSEPVNPLFAV